MPTARPSPLDSAETLRRELDRRILVLCAGSGSQSDDAERIAAAYRASLQAGADIIMARVAGIGDGTLRVARALADEFTGRDASHPRFVAGVVDLQACGAAAPPSDDLDRVEAICRQQAPVLVEGGVDIICIAAHEVRSARTGLFAIRRLLDERSARIPVWMMCTPDVAEGQHDCRLIHCQSLTAVFVALREPELAGIMVAAPRNSRVLMAALSELSAVAHARIALRLHSPEPAAAATAPTARAAEVREIAERGLLNVIGVGPCADVSQLAAIVIAVRGLEPRQLPPRPDCCWLSGSEPLVIRPGLQSSSVFGRRFIKVGERTSVAGSARFARLMCAGDYPAALEVARREIEQGAQIIDVNMDHPRLDPVRSMIDFMERLTADPVAGRVPLMIDSADWDVLAAGLRHLAGRGIINSINLQAGQDEFLRRARLIRDYGAVPLVLAMDADGPATTRERKRDICTRAFHILTDQVGFAPHDVILDPGLLPIGTGLPEHAGYAVAYIEACRDLKENLPGCLISGGVSNLSFAFRGSDLVRAALHAVFLQQAIPAGMDMGIVNPAPQPGVAELSDELREAAADVVLNRRADAAIRLARLARRTKAGEGT